MRAARALSVATGALVLVLALACTGMSPPLPSEVVLAAAEPLSNLGHPMARYKDAKVAGWNSGSMTSSGSHDTWVDMDVHYERKGTLHTMRVRFYVHSLDPCKITTDVLEDDGPPPLLLDNSLSSQAVGDEMCAQITEARDGNPQGG